MSSEKAHKTNKEAALRAEALAERIGHVFVATASDKGMPHLAAAGKLALRPDDRVSLREWFCSETIRNLEENPLVTLVVWDSNSDTGYQLVGKVENVHDLAMLDGYPEGKTLVPLPQVERELVIRVDEVMAFSQGPHSDVPNRTGESGGRNGNE
jgi:hypothetical protein